MAVSTGAQPPTSGFQAVVTVVVHPVRQRAFGRRSRSESGVNLTRLSVFVLIVYLRIMYNGRRLFALRGLAPGLICASQRHCSFLINRVLPVARSFCGERLGMHVILPVFRALLFSQAVSCSVNRGECSLLIAQIFTIFTNEKATPCQPLYNRSSTKCEPKRSPAAPLTDFLHHLSCKNENGRT